MGTFDHSTTSIKVGSVSTRPIHIRRGVKQGDPLSPILFNFVVDELMEGRNRDYAEGTISSDHTIAAMAFADDLVLMEDRQDRVPLMLHDTATFFRHRGMRLNPGKSTSISALPARGDKKPLPATRPVFAVDGSKIPVVQVLSTFKYLGHHFGPTGIHKPSICNLQQ